MPRFCSSGTTYFTKSSNEPGWWVGPMTKPSQAGAVNHSSSMSAISFGPPTQGLLSRPRPVIFMKSRTVGFRPLVDSTRSRMVCMPWMPSISASVNGSSSPLVAKSKLSASDRSESWSTSFGSLS